MTTLMLALIGFFIALVAGVAGRARRPLRPEKRRAAEASLRAAVMTAARAACVIRAFSQHATSEGVLAVSTRICAMTRQRLAEPD